MQERREYAELVKDVLPPSKDDSPEPFSSYKDHIGFGLHVVVVMFTSYLVGFAAFRALFSNSPVLNAAEGILGLVGGMLVETISFHHQIIQQRIGFCSKIKESSVDA